MQGEPAFDPFALMDEQPRSSGMMLRLEPEQSSRAPVSFWGLRPSFEVSFLEPDPGAEETEIGCCGFQRYYRSQD